MDNVQCLEVEVEVVVEEDIGGIHCEKVGKQLCLCLPQSLVFTVTLTISLMNLHIHTLTEMGIEIYHTSTYYHVPTTTLNTE